MIYSILIMKKGQLLIRTTAKKSLTTKIPKEAKEAVIWKLLRLGACLFFKYDVTSYNTSYS